MKEGATGLQDNTDPCSLMSSAQTRLLGSVSPLEDAACVLPPTLASACLAQWQTELPGKAQGHPWLLKRRGGTFLILSVSGRDEHSRDGPFDLSQPFRPWSSDGREKDALSWWGNLSLL